MANRYGPKTITENLVFCLDSAITKSYPGTGNTWYDLSSNKNNGILTNGPIFSDNNKGIIVFDGSNDYVQIDKTAGNFGISSASSKFTISLWYKDNSNGSANKQIFTTYKGYNAFIALYAASNYRFYVIVKDNDGDQSAFATPNNTYGQNEWVNGVLVWDGSTKTIYCYLNGQLMGSNTNNLVGNTFEYSVDPVKFRIGATSVASWSFGELPFNGSISNIQMYTTALSEKQILNNYKAIKGRYEL